MDPYLRLLADGSVPGRLARGLARRLGLPTPVRLRRHSPGDPLVPGIVLYGGGPGGRLLEPALGWLRAGEVEIRDGESASDTRPYAVVFDASGITDSTRLAEAHAFLHPLIRRIDTCGRLLVLASDPDSCADFGEATAQAALDGLVRSVAREIGHGGTANLLRVAPGGERALAGPLGFLLSPRSAYVSGQTIHVRTPFPDPPDPPGSPVPAEPADQPDPADPAKPLAGHRIVVTGAARGIGAEIARTLARDGGSVICLDLASQLPALESVAEQTGGVALPLDITAEDAGDALATRLTELAEFSRDDEGIHAIVHNAGVLRDRTLGRMTAEEWNTVLAVNLTAQERLDAALFERKLLRPGGRLVSIASVSGIAGNRGQANYATSKAGVIGRVRALAGRDQDRNQDRNRDQGRRGAPRMPANVTVNAVAPGFIETAMTDSMPLLPREVGRRLSSLGQGGLPIDVAETVAFLVSPDAYAVHGNVIRVCGQSMLGA